MSSGVIFSTWRGQALQAARMSRCVVTTALGTPVVPLVKASRAMSSAAVAQPAWSGERRAARCSSPSGRPESPNARIGSLPRASCAASTMSSSRSTSHSASAGCALSITLPSSSARNSGMVGTTISPALTTASQASAMPIELPPRSSTRLPGASCRPWIR